MDRILQMLSLAQKAGKIASGEFACEKAIKDQKAYLVILSEEAGVNTRKHFSDMCAYRKIPVKVYGSKEELGRSLGKEYRAVLAIIDKGFSDNIFRLLAEV